MNVGDRPQEVFFGGKAFNPDVAQFVVPVELIAACFFILVALMFVGLGQVFGRAFDAYPDPLNIGGIVAGIFRRSCIVICGGGGGGGGHLPGSPFYFINVGPLSAARVLALLMSLVVIGVPIDLV